MWFTLAAVADPKEGARGGRAATIAASPSRLRRSAREEGRAHTPPPSRQVPTGPTPTVPATRIHHLSLAVDRKAGSGHLATVAVLPQLSATGGTMRLSEIS
jgi:hypothetical protein